MQRRLTIIMVLMMFLFSIIMPILVNATYVICDHQSNDFQIILRKSVNANYDMIVISPSCYQSVLEPFVEHKNNCEIATMFVSIDDVYDGTFFAAKGRDDQEVIKYFIKDSVENWGITYVLFVGNFKQIPVRYVYNNDSYPPYPEPKFISELYYADIYNENGSFSSWDSDGDDIFGEWNGEVAEDKLIDLVPDVCLGRLACANIKEVEIMVDKIINYEEETLDSSWFKKMVVVGGDTYDNFPGYEGEIYNQLALDAMDGFIPVKLWASTGTLTKHGWSIVRALNRGCGFLYLSGHGSNSIWATYTPDGSYIGKFGLFHMLFLFNRHMLPVCLVGGCHNSEFAVGSCGVDKNPWKPGGLFRSWFQACWSWRLASVPYGGSIATIGATGLCWYSVEYGGGGTDWLNVNFFREYANDNVVLGQIWKDSLTKYLDNFSIDWETPAGGNSSIDAKTVQQWTLLGDPSLVIGGVKSVSVNNQNVQDECLDFGMKPVICHSEEDNIYRFNSVNEDNIISSKQFS